MYDLTFVFDFSDPFAGSCAALPSLRIESARDYVEDII